MRIAIAKPDHHVVGGFERVVMRVAEELEERGHTVSWLTVDVPSAGPTAFGVGVPDDIFREHPAFFGYMALMDGFQRLDASGHDVLISTQPPSFAVSHPHHLALFYHHERVYYDLYDVFIKGGHVRQDMHERARALVRQIDRVHLDSVTHFLAGSAVVATRLREFNGLEDNVSVWPVGPAIAPGLEATADVPRSGNVLCVGRLSLGKRTELLVHAMKYLPDIRALVVGDGVRLPFVRALDARLSDGSVDLDAFGDEDLWLNRGDSPARRPTASPSSNVAFLGHVSDERLAELYRESFCVVAPSLGEDYGLIAIEAMAHGRPIIACNDGGGLTELVSEGETGIIVEPDGRAIAAAIRQLYEDPDAAQAMGRRGLEQARRCSWRRAIDELEARALEVAATPS